MQPILKDSAAWHFSCSCAEDSREKGTRRSSRWPCCLYRECLPSRCGACHFPNREARCGQRKPNVAAGGSGGTGTSQMGYGDALLNPSSGRFRSPLAGPRIAPRERRGAIQEGGRSERAADRFRAAQRRHRLGRGGRVDQVAEPPVASLEHRRDDHKAVVTSHQVAADARPAPVLRAGGRTAPHLGSARRSARRSRDDPRPSPPIRSGIETHARSPASRIDDRAVAPLPFADRPPQRLPAVTVG